MVPMKITLNGQPKTVATNSTVTDLLTSLDLADKRVAVEINQTIIPRSQHAQHALNEDDVVEIVVAVGGG